MRTDHLLQLTRMSSPAENCTSPRLQLHSVTATQLDNNVIRLSTRR